MSYITKTIEALNERYNEVKDLWDNYVSNFNESEKYATEIVCADFESFLEWYEEEESINTLLSDDYDMIEDKHFTKYVNYKWDEYGVTPNSEGVGHGFLFSDGTQLDVNGHDHHIIDCETWYTENIITICSRPSESSINIRLNDTSFGIQKRAIEEMVEASGFETIYYDVYRENNIIDSGTLESYEHKKIWEL